MGGRRCLVPAELVSRPGRWGSGIWRAIKGVPNVIYETGSMVAPLTIRYFLSDESEHPHCQQVMLCEMNVRVKERFGKPGEIAMQLASSMAVTLLAEMTRSVTTRWWT